MDAKLTQRIESDFAYHAANEEQKVRMQLVRETLAVSAHYLTELLPPCRELSTALTKLEEAMFHANAGICRNPAYYESLKQVKAHQAHVDEINRILRQHLDEIQASFKPH